MSRNVFEVIWYLRMWQLDEKASWAILEKCKSQPCLFIDLFSKIWSPTLFTKSRLKSTTGYFQKKLSPPSKDNHLPPRKELRIPATAQPGISAYMESVMGPGEHLLQVGSLWRPSTASHSSLKPSNPFGVQRTKDAQRIYVDSNTQLSLFLVASVMSLVTST